MDELTRSLDGLVSDYAPKSEDFENRNEILRSLNNLLTSKSGPVKDVLAFAYGSFKSGFFSCKSDLDIAVKGLFPKSALDFKGTFLAQEILQHHPEYLTSEWLPLHLVDKETKVKLLRNIAKHINAAGLAAPKSMEYVFFARVPLIKFVHKRFGIDCDLTIGGDESALKALFQQHIGKVNDEYARLYSIVKQWMKAHQMNDGSRMTFNSHCVALLTAHHLQQRTPAALPPLYKLMFSTRPDRTEPRLLEPGSMQDRDLAIRMSATRCTRARHEYNFASGASLAWLFSGFVDGLQPVLKARLEPSSRVTRLSSWFGDTTFENPTHKPYCLIVEEPFDATDNVARTFRTMVRTWSQAGSMLIFSQLRRQLRRHPSFRLRSVMLRSPAPLAGPDLIMI